LASIDELPPDSGLSLREAITIAQNRAGRDRIVFDSEVFPVAQPATIALDSTLNVAGETTIDARATGGGVELPATGSVFEIDGDDVTLRGMRVRGGVRGIDVTNVSNIRLERLAIESPTAEGIYVEGSSQTTIVDCVIDGAGPVALQVLQGA